MRLTKKQYEVVTSLTALTIAAMSAVLYFETTENAKHWYQRWSGIVANVIINHFVTKESIDYLVNLCNDKKKLQAFIAGFTAILAYAPQTAIAWFEAPEEFSLGMKIFATAATGLSGGALYAYAVAQLPSFVSNSLSTIKSEVPYFVRQMRCTVSSEEKAARLLKDTVIGNLKALQQRVRVSNYHAENPEATARSVIDTNQALLAACFDMATSAPEPKFQSARPCVSTLTGGAIFLLKLMTAGTLLYGSIGYTCDTEKSLRVDFGVGAVLAVIAANILMFLQYVLASKGGFGLISGLAENAGAFRFGRFLTNDNTVGGTIGTVISATAPLVAGTIASYSGYTGEELYNKGCPSSQMRGAMFPQGGSFVSYATAGFNGIYDTMAICWMVRYCVNHVASSPRNTEDQDYLKISSALNALIGDVSRMAPAAMDEFLNALNEDTRRNLMGDVFAPMSEYQESLIRP